MMKSLALAAPIAVALAAAAFAAPAPQGPPPGPYQETCSNIHVEKGPLVSILYATCAPSRKESSIPLPCVGEIINRNGELVCRPRR